MKFFIWLIFAILILYVSGCSILAKKQDKLIFYPEKLDANFKFNFSQEYTEVNLITPDKIYLNALLFKAKNSKGVIYYLHGNAGSLRTWAKIADVYTKLNYDIFFIDYRGYGKSTGSISNEQQQYADMQLGYDFLKNKYDENKIVVLGYSIGTGSAAYIAANNKPKLLILQAPYYNFADLVRNYSIFIPKFILKYKFAINEFLPKCSMPVIIFHGTADKIIYYGSSLKLQKLMKPADKLITLPNENHNGITENPIYLKELSKLLSV